jgi:CxxC motif-containing protein (DUF1111 family)|uniref:di-heme oxidoredictase family protein n=1 Tax=Algoriphagus sp. TaxID=1872435 RepID=UPI00258AD02A|nr:di-heme oxidoredictase family protein [Algoriphagus sp.]
MKKLFLILLGCIALGCEQIIPETPLENEILDGPINDLRTDEQAQFLAGDIAFNEEVFTATSGLGPLFVATSCGSCHAGDGKGHPFTTLTRYGQTVPNKTPDFSTGGPQLQNRAIPGYFPEKLPAGVLFMKMTPPAVTDWVFFLR